MGTTNHGTQEITYEYFEEATAKDFNKRHLNIQPRGVYKGGYLVRVSDSEVTLSIFTAEIGDDNEQISVKTSTIATLNSSTLDSGSISSGTPFLVLRWGFLERADNYVEVHAIASVAAAQANDIIIGKCTFSGATLTGFDYTDRTFLNIQDLFFKVEISSGIYVQLRAGRIQDDSQYIIVPEQKVGPFSVPGSPNSRIDLVYIDTDGTVMIQQGVQAVSPTAPDYESRLVVAEVRIVNGDTSIPADRITDVRSFLIPFEALKKYDSGWFAVSVNTTYIKAHGLNAVPFIIQCWFSNSSDGSGDVIPCNSGFEDNYRGLRVVDIDATNIKIRGSGVLTRYSDAGGINRNRFSGYARIVAIK